MEYSSVHVGFNLEGRARTPEFGLKSTVVIRLTESLRELYHESDATASVLQEFPFRPTWSFAFDIPARAFASPGLLSLYINQLLSYHIWNAALSDHLTPQIVEAAYRIGCGRQGFFFNVKVDVVHEVLVDRPRGRGAKARVLEWLRKERRVDSRVLVDADGVCCVCLEELRDVSSLIEMLCSHLFHEDCILKWLETQNSCPLCRRPSCEDGLC